MIKKKLAIIKANLANLDISEINFKVKKKGIMFNDIYKKDNQFYQEKSKKRAKLTILSI